ncbi:hypothetical protein PMAYCL1PPCAC_06510, partial [Pristionchus mayeri]
MRETLPLLLLFLSRITSSDETPKALEASIRASDAFIEKPQLECQSSGLRLHLKPINNFTGHVYVRGFFNDKRCHLDYGSRPMSSPFYVDVPYLGECAVQKQRMADPAGIIFSIVVIAQKHRMLVTHGDRAFRLNCFYRQSETRLEHSLDVSDISPSPLDPPPVLPPSCHYDVLSSSMNGPKIRTATVGEPVIHRWTCDAKTTGFLVHSCMVRDPTGEEYQLVDERGCVTDRSLVSPLTYSTDLSVVFTTIPAFRFAEQVLLVLFTCQITVCEKAEDGCEGIAPPQCEQLSHDLPIKTEYKKHRPESESNKDLLPVREEIGGMKSDGEETYERKEVGRNEDGRGENEKRREEEEKEKLKKKLIGSWTDEGDDNEDRIVGVHGGSTTTTPETTTTKRKMTTSTTPPPSSTRPSTPLPPPIDSPSNDSDQPSKLADKFPKTYETTKEKEETSSTSSDSDSTRIDPGSSPATEEESSKITTTTEQPPDEQTYASLTVFPSSRDTTESSITTTEAATESTRISLGRDETESYSTLSPISSSPSSIDPFVGKWPSDSSTTTTSEATTTKSEGTTEETTTEVPRTAEKGTQTDDEDEGVRVEGDGPSSTQSSIDEGNSTFTLNSTTTLPKDSDESSLYGAVPSPSSYISSPQEPFSANEEFSSKHVAEKMKAGPNTGNYDTSMGGSGLEEKKAQLVARSKQRGPDMAVHSPPPEIRDNSQPLRRIDADRRPIQASSPQFSIDSSSEVVPSVSSLPPIIPIVTSPLTRLPTDHPTRNAQWSPPVWESFPAPRHASIFRVGEKRRKRETEKEGRRKKREEITVDVHADEILVLTTEEVALQKAQSDSNQIESHSIVVDRWFVHRQAPI